MSSAASKELKGGRYTLIRKLGEGSQGETYEATDNGSSASDAPLAEKWVRYVRDQKTGGDVRRTAKLVAIKCFRVGSAKSWKDVELAEREARTLASLHHPKLPRYFEHFEEDGALYLVMEKIEGESLAAIRKNKRAMSAAEVGRMLEDISEALRYLHARAPVVVHRDIKPGNVIRRPDGSFALVDFGAVRDRLKPTGGSTVVGTFGYMAPEQFQGRAAPASDVYGLGATAITMLTGTDPEELPHEGLGIDVERALPRGTPKPLARALSAMLVADPDQRVSSADEVLALLAGGPRNDDAPPSEDGGDARAPGRRSKRHGNQRGSGSKSRLNRKQLRALAKREEAEARRSARAERQGARALVRARRAPFVFRLVGRLGLLVALLVVWGVVGLVVPFLLIVLSLIFGGALRRAAAACVQAARRSQAALGRASMRLSGRAVEAGDATPTPAASPKVRVAREPTRVRAAVHDERDDEREEEETESDPAAELDGWMEERLEKEAQRERMRQHARAPARRKFWGR